MDLDRLLQTNGQIIIRQVREGIELLGFEGRNRYDIMAPDGTVIAHAAEAKQGLLGMLFRQVMRHWRSFDIQVLALDGSITATAHHPFRFYFQRLEISDSNQKLIGLMEKEFSIFSKKFLIHDNRGTNSIQMYAGMFKIWRYPFSKSGVEVASVTKKWSGALREIFTDADTFLLEFASPALTLNERKLLLMAALFIDLQYFEENKGIRLTSLLSD